MAYKEYWAYQEVTKNWESDVKTFRDGATVTIWYNKAQNDPYAEFRIEYDDGYWYVYDDTQGGMLINTAMDYTDTLEDCIRGCFYYFHTRY